MKPKTLELLKDFFMSFILVSIFTVIIYAGYIYFSIPKNANIYYPGDLIPINEMLEDENETNLFAVTVKSALIEKRSQFLKIMWEERRPILRYSYIVYEDKEKLLDSYIDSLRDSLDIEIEAQESIIDYSIDRYDENEAEIESLLQPLSWYMDMYGDSATLLIMIYLIGLHEDKPWINSDKKIAMTASLDENGNVLPVGSVNLKAMVAKSDHADVFIVPLEQIDEARKVIKENSTVQVVGVETIEETINWLDQHIK